MEPRGGQASPADVPGAARVAAGTARHESPVRREFFTVDLRGLRAALGARAAGLGVAESEVLRSALAAALADGRPLPMLRPESGEAEAAASRHLKISLRLPHRIAARLDRHARATGLSRGAYLTRLIDSAPPVVASADRAAGAAALNASAAEMALLSRDLHHLTQLLRMGSSAAARQYHQTLERLDADLRAHLDLAAAALADLAPQRAARVRDSRVNAHPGRES